MPPDLQPNAMKASLDRSYFEKLYEHEADPWHFETSAYEREKYDATIAMLDGMHFKSGFEIGCSIGVLTARLASVCDALLAVDINARALAVARSRCANLPQVSFAEMAFPGEFPAGRFDLTVVSEVAYYWSDGDLNLAIERIAESTSGGTLELVHFLPVVEEYVRTGDAVHDIFLADTRFSLIRQLRAERYRIDVLAVS